MGNLGRKGGWVSGVESRAQTDRLKLLEYYVYLILNAGFESKQSRNKSGVGVAVWSGVSKMTF